MNFKIAGSATNYIAEVDVNNNLKANLPTTEAQSGFASMSSEIDAGTVTGSRYNKSVEVSDDFRVRVGVDTMLFNDTFVGTAINTANWSTVLTTMTNTVASGFSSLNAGLSTAAADRVQAEMQGSTVSVAGMKVPPTVL